MLAFFLFFFLKKTTEYLEKYSSTVCMQGLASHGQIRTVTEWRKARAWEMVEAKRIG